MNSITGAAINGITGAAVNPITPQSHGFCEKVNNVQDEAGDFECACNPPQTTKKHGSGGGQSGSPGCKGGVGEYNLIPVLKENGAQIGYNGQENWYFKNNAGNDLLLYLQHSIPVGPLCCSDCCASECSKMDPSFLCGKPIIYDGNGKPREVENALRVCRPIVREIDEKKCKPGQLACLGGLTVTGPAGQVPSAQVPAVQQPAQAPASPSEKPNDCTCGVACVNPPFGQFTEISCTATDEQRTKDCMNYCESKGVIGQTCPEGEIPVVKGVCSVNPKYNPSGGSVIASIPSVCKCVGGCMKSSSGEKIGCCTAGKQGEKDCTESCEKNTRMKGIMGLLRCTPNSDEFAMIAGTCTDTGTDCSKAGGFISQVQQAGAENQLPVEAQSGAGQAVGAYGGKTSIAGALVAGIILIAGLIVVAVLIANRPGKPISGTKLQTQIDSHVAVLRKLEETIGNIEKKRKP